MDIDDIESIIPIIYLGVAILMGLIPAAIAKKKGRSFIGWWIYGSMLFTIALIHSALISEKYGSYSKPAIGKGQYVKTAIWIFLYIILKFLLFQNFGFSYVVAIVFAIFLLVPRNKGTNVVLMLLAIPYLISCIIDVFSGGGYGGLLYSLPRLLTLAADAYFFFVMLFGAFPSKRSVALGALKARALPGIFMLIAWLMSFVTLAMQLDYMDSEGIVSLVLGGFVRVMLFFSLGKSLCRVYGADHPYALAAAAAASYYSAPSSTTASAANTVTSTPKPATTTYTPTTTPTTAPKPSTTTTQPTPTPAPAPKPEPTPAPKVEPKPAPAPKPEPKPAPAPKPAAKKPAPPPPPAPVAVEVPAFDLQGTEGRELTVYEDRVILVSSAGIEDDAESRSMVEQTFRYNQLDGAEFKKGGVMYGSIFLAVHGSEETSENVFGKQTFLYMADTCNNADAEAAYRFIKKKIREAKKA